MDSVNKVIAAILNDDLAGGKTGISGGRSRSPRRHARGQEHGIMGSFQTRVRAMAGGSDVAVEPAAPVASAQSVDTITAGKRRSRSAIKRTHSAVMRRYDAIRSSPRTRNLPGNVALKMAMQSVKKR